MFQILVVPPLLFLNFWDTLGQGLACVPFELGLHGLSYVSVFNNFEKVFYFVFGSGAPSSTY